jgi:ribosomal 50S subunit-recycling heat shock protein
VMHKFLRHANFFLKLITRSMAQHILESGRIKVSECIRKKIKQVDIQFYFKLIK